MNNKIEKVLIVGDYLEMSSDLPELINTYGFNCNKLSQYIVEKKKTYYEQLAQFIEGTSFYYIDVNTHFAEQNHCILWSNKRIPFTWDNQHLSHEFQLRLLDKDVAELKQYFNPK